MIVLYIGYLSYWISKSFQILKYICIDSVFSYLLCLCWMLSRNVGIQFVNSLLPTMFPMKRQLGLKSFNTSEVMFFCAGSAPQDGRQLALEQQESLIDGQHSVACQ